MASGDVVLSVSGALVLENAEQAEDYCPSQKWPWIVKLQKSPTTQYNQVNLDLVVGHNNPESSLFDITKTYNITITEV